MADQQEDRQQQQNMLDALLVPIDDQVKIGLNNFRIALEKSQPDVISMADKQQDYHQQQQQQQQQQNILDALLVPIDEQLKIGLSNFMIALEKYHPDVIYKVCLAIL
nr:hypothetical protein [Tanacetum cinerariifolium]